MQKLHIKCEKVKKRNLSKAIEIQKAIFPKENGALNLKASADTNLIEKVYGKNYRKSVDFWICKNSEGKNVGITGIYSYIEYPYDAWCGWFGILSKYQGQGYGRILFEWTIKKAKELGFKNFRLYTDLNDNKIAAELYRKVGMIEEPYTLEDMGEEKIVIFSKSLVSDIAEKLGNKNLFLKKQEEIQKRANDEILN